MNGRILVGYATVHGSMREVAADVAARLQARGWQAETLPLRDAHSLAGYRAVVMGAPLYIFRWHQDAHTFLTRHREALEGGLPAAVFAGGPTGPEADLEWETIRGQMDRELAKHPWFRPVDLHLVGGKFDPSALRFPTNLIPAMRMMSACDRRNWEDIRVWADAISGTFLRTAHTQEGS